MGTRDEEFEGEFGLDEAGRLIRRLKGNKRKKLELPPPLEKIIWLKPSKIGRGTITPKLPDNPADLTGLPSIKNSDYVLEYPSSSRFADLTDAQKQRAANTLGHEAGHLFHRDRLLGGMPFLPKNTEGSARHVREEVLAWAWIIRRIKDPSIKKDALVQARESIYSYMTLMTRAERKKWKAFMKKNARKLREIFGVEREGSDREIVVGAVVTLLGRDARAALRITKDRGVINRRRAFSGSLVWGEHRGRGFNFSEVDIDRVVRNVGEPLYRQGQGVIRSGDGASNAHKVTGITKSKLGGFAYELDSRKGAFEPEEQLRPISELEGGHQVSPGRTTLYREDLQGSRPKRWKRKKCVEGEAMPVFLASGGKPQGYFNPHMQAVQANTGERKRSRRPKKIERGEVGHDPEAKKA